uniref:Uncharacterized protein LOC113788178 n=1 Tax=Cicer arietinum TaxID=3827 RepID=A0A3Q7YH75_CICAR|nr:uncharacterized protein LOC113788178 [Cicer arietinum]
MATPMHPTRSLEKDDSSKKVDQKTSRGMIRSLFYLTASRPDMMFSIPKRHYQPYLFYKISPKYKLSGYCDSNYVGDKLEKKNTSGNFTFLGDNLISWSSERQSTIVMLTTKVEYISAADCSSQLLLMKHQLEDYKI